MTKISTFLRSGHTHSSGISMLSRSQTSHQRHGYAMGMFLVVLSVLTTSTVMLLNSSASESRNSFQARELVKARSVGISAIEDLFARLQTDPKSLDKLKAGTYSDVSFGSTSTWFRSSGGALQRCVDSKGSEDFSTPCFTLTVSPRPGVSGATTVRSLVLTSKVRYACRGTQSSCSTLTMSQRLRSWQFSDFLFYTEYNVASPSVRTILDPSNSTVSGGRDSCAVFARNRFAPGSGLDESNCPTVAYTKNFSANFPSADVVNGPVYTADDYVMVCGTPDSTLFRSQVYAYGDATTQSALRNAATRGDSCGAPWPSNLTVGTATASRLLLPSAKTTFAKAANMAGSNALVALPGQSAEVKFKSNGDVVVSNVTGGTRTISASTTDVITIDSNAPDCATNATACRPVSITDSVVIGKISLFVKGDMQIDGDITNASSVNGNGLNENVLGLNATGDILISKIPARNCNAPNVREINAQMVSFEGTVRTAGLDLNPDITVAANPASQFCPPTLRFIGSMATRYQGVYGFYDAGAGLIVEGYVKDFAHDTRGVSDPTINPPYLITPVGLQWVRVNLSENLD
jgi:hypothetical protein